MFASIRSFRQGLLDAVFPPSCLVCRVPVNGTPLFCTDCRRSLLHDPLPSCPRCAATIGLGLKAADDCVHCRGTKLAFNSALRLGVYDDKLREAILIIKEAEGEPLAEALGQLWAAHSAAAFQELNPQLIVPIPLHWWRRLKRGHNQAVLIAQALSDSLRIPCRPSVLNRVRNTPHQMGQNVAARRENVRGAFRLRADVKGLRILLVDDVLTTGATADSAANALKEGGAARVDIAVLARR